MKKQTILALLLLIMPIVLFGQNKAKVNLYYFHATVRCEGCLKIEKYVEMAINELYAKEIKNGILVYKSLDFMEAKNEELAKKYDIDSQNLILSVMNKGKEKKWLNLEDIWDKISSYEDFKKYIKDNLDKFLK